MTVEHPFNKIVEGIGVSDIRQFDAEVSSIPGIIKLTLGEPNFDTPEHIKEAAIQAIKDNHSHYTPNSGIPELRQAAAAYYNKKFNLHWRPSDYNYRGNRRNCGKLTSHLKPWRHSHRANTSLPTLLANHIGKPRELHYGGHK